MGMGDDGKKLARGRVGMDESVRERVVMDVKGAGMGLKLPTSSL